MANTEANEFSNLLLSLYRASREVPLEEFQDAALNLVKPWLQFDSSAWCSGTLTLPGISIHAVHLHNASSEVLDAYEEVKQQDAAVETMRTKSGGTIAYNSAALFSGK